MLNHILNGYHINLEPNFWTSLSGGERRRLLKLQVIALPKNGDNSAFVEALLRLGEWISLAEGLALWAPEEKETADLSSEDCCG